MKEVTCQGEQMRGMRQQIKGHLPLSAYLLCPRTHHRVSSPASSILPGQTGGSHETHYLPPLCDAKRGRINRHRGKLEEPTAGSSISGFGGQSVLRLRPEALLTCHDVVCGFQYRHPSP